MRRQSIQGFAIGMFLTAVVLSLVYQMTSDSNEVEVDDAVATLEKNEYIVLSANEWEEIQQKLSTKETEQKETEAPQEEQANPGTDTDSAEQDEVNNETEPKKTYSLVIKPGMSSSEVGYLLEENGIVEDARAFNKYIVDRKLEGYIQIGTHTVTSDMSFDVIADTISK
ncbi:hypothetical protein GCM10008967_40100 [Bacillus carboniphilus]|uniref:Endolytic transglycosylase MltG n=1 Tax=Bacillus carboniphilus TaxID=86663 RepID=A0ABN0WSU0_9BACI